MVKIVKESYEDLQKYGISLFVIAVYNNGEFVGYLESTYNNWNGGITVKYVNANRFDDAKKFYVGGRDDNPPEKMIRYLKRFGKNENDAIEDHWGSKRETVGEDGIDITFEIEDIGQKAVDKEKRDKDYNRRYEEIRRIAGSINNAVLYLLDADMTEDEYQELLSYVDGLEKEIRGERSRFRKS